MGYSPIFHECLATPPVSAENDSVFRVYYPYVAWRTEAFGNGVVPYGYHPPEPPTLSIYLPKDIYENHHITRHPFGHTGPERLQPCQHTITTRDRCDTRPCRGNRRYWRNRKHRSYWNQCGRSRRYWCHRRYR